MFFLTKQYNYKKKNILNYIFFSTLDHIIYSHTPAYKVIK